MKKKLFILLPVAVVLLLALVLGLQWFYRARPIPPVKEIPVEVETIQPAGEGLWLVSPKVLDRGSRTVRTARLKNLRAQMMAVEVIQTDGERVVIRNRELQADDLLIRQPGRLIDGQAVIPQGLAAETLLRLTFEAGLAALRTRDLQQSLRFISPTYGDSWGFNSYFLQELLKRVYREFDDLRLELASEPEIRIEGHRALVQAKVRLTALYQSRRNFLLGNQNEFNALVFQFEQAAPGWKITNLKGLRPLGFDERFFRLLGGDIGLPLTEAERRDKQAACMPCRERMAERFGTQ
ncbi:MAG: hypothetical protein HY892_16760 [Deltaproteobacteria bacterium]|nr:hypothetical protein [Deltaproteobacteria bacterium]